MVRCIGAASSFIASGTRGPYATPRRRGGIYTLGRHGSRCWDRKPNEPSHLTGTISPERRAWGQRDNGVAVRLAPVEGDRCETADVGVRIRGSDNSANQGLLVLMHACRALVCLIASPGHVVAVSGLRAQRPTGSPPTNVLVLSLCWLFSGGPPASSVTPVSTFFISPWPVCCNVSQVHKFRSTYAKSRSSFSSARGRGPGIHTDVDKAP
jgi:hypothetical protein